LSLEDHVQYAESIYHSITIAGVPAAGYFGDGSSGEHGIRTNNNYSHLYAFLYMESVRLTEQEKDNLKSKAVSSIVYAVNVHQTIGTANTLRGGKWGFSWQSSRYAAPLAYAAHIFWDDLDVDTQTKLEKVVVAEADKNAARIPPTNVVGDTKAEENAWDTE